MSDTTGGVPKPSPTEPGTEGSGVCLTGPGSSAKAEPVTAPKPAPAEPAPAGGSSAQG